MITTISLFMSLACFVLAFMLWQEADIKHANDSYSLQKCAVIMSHADDFERCDFDTAWGR